MFERNYIFQTILGIQPLVFGGVNISFLGGFDVLDSFEKLRLRVGSSLKSGTGCFFFPETSPPKTKITGGYEKILELVRR